jgi:hypothetical protein
VSQLAASCASPRIGTNPSTGLAYPDRPGTLNDEKAWLRAWIDEFYLWYLEVPASDPAQYPTAVAYFAALKTPLLTLSGKPKDRFHFSYPTATWIALSQSGVEPGYGVQWALVSATPPRRLVVAYVEPVSPAATAGLSRGTVITSIDGVDVAQGTDVATLNAGLVPSAVGQVHWFGFTDAQGFHTVSITSADVTLTPVSGVATLPAGGRTFGYMLFNDQVATAEALLIAAVNQLKAAAVDDLVIDLRYNGGGYLAIASETAYMVAGPTATAGKTFEQLTFNDRTPGRNPFTGQPLAPLPFLSTAVGFSAPTGTALPSLGLRRVFVLTGSGTCSASESIINSLRGIGIQVIQVGGTTCGKPYGFVPQDNCGTTYFAIQSQGVNQLGFGDYGDGLVPGGPGANGVPGCPVDDDFGHALGDPSEARLSAALYFGINGTCPPLPVAVARMQAKPAPAGDGLVVKSPWRENRILTP